MKLEEYQLRAVTFLVQHPRAVLSMDMGLGKTATVIEALNRLGVRRALIVAPKRVALSVWSAEAKKWNDPHEWTVIQGTPSQRAVLWRRKTARTVCSYEQLAEAPTLDYEAVVFDELTRLKHVTSKRFLYALGIKTAIRWGLTGTLLPNGAIDLFGQLAALGIYRATPHTHRRGKFYIPEFFRWRVTYFEDLNAFSALPFHRWRILPPHTLKSILEPVKGQIFTLRAEDYATLPPMRTLYHPHTLSEKERARYMDAKTLLRVEDEERIIALNDKGVFQKLQTLCSGFIYDPATSATRRGIDNTPTEEAKRNLTTLVDKVLDPLRTAWGAPIVVNSGYRCPALNEAVGGSKTSDHMTGRAADIEAADRTAASNARLFALAQSLGISFDQLIDESNMSWVHVSYRSEAENRKQILKL